MNYMKILITNPDLQGNIYIDEMTYTYDSENNLIKRFLIPQIQKFHPYRKQQLIVGFIINSDMDNELVQFQV